MIDFIIKTKNVLILIKDTSRFSRNQEDFRFYGKEVLKSKCDIFSVTENLSYRRDRKRMELKIKIFFDWALALCTAGDYIYSMCIYLLI